jgi:hypothetical protein
MRIPEMLIYLRPDSWRIRRCDFPLAKTGLIRSNLKILPPADVEPQTQETGIR